MKELHCIFKLTVVVCCLYGVSPANIPDPNPHATPASTTTQANKAKIRNCSEINAQLLSWDQDKQDGLFIYEQSRAANCTGEEVIIKETEMSKVEQWKTNVIISCTVTAAIEVFIIIIIILYWKQIRWSLRKLKCPCDESQGNNSSQQAPAVRRNVARESHTRSNRQSRPSPRNGPQIDQSELTPINSDIETPSHSENIRAESSQNTTELNEFSVNENQSQSNIPASVTS